ncbi:MAG: DnaA N-terminal domain-containing protein, partial [Burkholderiales bacterium]
MDHFWLSCLNHFEKELTAQQFNTWIKPLKFVPEADALFLVAPNRFVLDWIRERFLARIQKMAELHFSKPVNLVLALQEKSVSNPVQTEKVKPAVAKTSNKSQTRLNPSFSFDNFVTGKANELARAAAIQVAEHPGTAYN